MPLKPRHAANLCRNHRKFAVIPCFFHRIFAEKKGEPPIMFLLQNSEIGQKIVDYQKLYLYLPSETQSAMCTRSQCISRLTAATPYLRDKFQVKSLCLFGSMARGDNTEASDVDVCVDMPAKAFQIVALKHYLQDLLGVSVDVVRKTPYLDRLLVKEIKRDGIDIFA